MISEIGEPIIVAAVFRQGKIIPRQFLWRRRSYKVKKVTGHYYYFKGIYRQDCFSLICESDSVYEVSFDSESMSWRLERIYYER